MLVSGVLPVADAQPAPDRLQLVAMLLGILVFGVIVLLVERRNSRHEAAPPGQTGSTPPARPVPIVVYRPPAPSVPTASAREAAVEQHPDRPYPVPFLDSDPAQPAGTNTETTAGSGVAGSPGSEPG